MPRTTSLVNNVPIIHDPELSSSVEEFNMKAHDVLTRSQTIPPAAMVIVPGNSAYHHPCLQHQPLVADMMVGIKYNMAGTTPSEELMVAPPDLQSGPGPQAVLPLVPKDQVHQEKLGAALLRIIYSSKCV